MKRDELEVGGLYVGPDGKCYRIVDTEPGWRVDHEGNWIQESVIRSRYVPGKGSVPYRTNLAVKAVIHEGNASRNAVVDPRKLSGTWEDHQRAVRTSKVCRKEASSVVRAVRKVLASTGSRPSPESLYGVADDGSTVSLPTRDLSGLLSLMPALSADSTGSATDIAWSSP